MSPPHANVTSAASQSFSLEGTAHVGDAALYSIHVPSFKFKGLPILTISLIFGHGANGPGDLDLLTFKLGHGSPVSCATFLLILSFLCPSVLDLGSDSRTDSGHRPSMHRGGV